MQDRYLTRKVVACATKEIVQLLFRSFKFEQRENEKPEMLCNIPCNLMVTNLIDLYLVYLSRKRQAYFKYRCSKKKQGLGKCGAGVSDYQSKSFRND